MYLFMEKPLLSVLKKCIIIWKEKENGGSWTGSFRDDQFWDGEGVIYINSNGVCLRYEGEMFAGKRHGFGKLFYTDGVYEGQWTEGKRHGQGTMTWKKGSEWTGQFKDGSPRNGRGSWYYDTGKVTGLFVMGKCLG